MTAFDHKTIKDQIVAILQADTTNLYDPNGEGSLDKLVLIQTGYPNKKGELPKEGKQPFAFVTNGRPFHQIRQDGVNTGENPKSLHHTVNYWIYFGVKGKDSREAEEKLDDYQTLIEDNLQQDPQLKNGGAATVDDSDTMGAEDPFPQLKGQQFQMRYVILQVRKTTSQ